MPSNAVGCLARSTHHVRPIRVRLADSVCHRLHSRPTLAGTITELIRYVLPSTTLRLGARLPEDVHQHGPDGVRRLAGWRALGAQLPLALCLILGSESWF